MAVVCGTIDTSFTSWGTDIASRYNVTGDVVKTYLTEIALLAALLVTITVAFMMTPPPHNNNGMIRKIMSNSTDVEISAAEDALIDVYQLVWTFLSVMILITVLLCVFMIIIISLNPDKDGLSPSSYLLIRLGKVQKLPLQSFMFCIAVGIFAVVLWCIVALHWICCAIIFPFFLAHGIGIFIFFVFPLIGAFLDTLEAERASELHHLVKERLDKAGDGSLSPELKRRNKAAARERTKRNRLQQTQTV